MRRPCQRCSWRRENPAEHVTRGIDVPENNRGRVRPALTRRACQKSGPGNYARLWFDSPRLPDYVSHAGFLARAHTPIFSRLFFPFLVAAVPLLDKVFAAVRRPQSGRSILDGDRRQIYDLLARHGCLSAELRSRSTALRSSSPQEESAGCEIHRRIRGFAVPSRWDHFSSRGCPPGSLRGEDFAENGNHRAGAVSADSPGEKSVLT